MLRNTMVCTHNFARAPFGRLIVRHKTFKKLVWSAARACAMDRIATKGLRQGNIRTMMGAVCRGVKTRISRGKPSKLLCRVVKRCGLRCHKCGLDKPPTRLWRIARVKRHPKHPPHLKDFLKKHARHVGHLAKHATHFKKQKA
jgi:hypothetical protein